MNESLRLLITAAGVLIGLISLIIGFYQRLKHESAINRNFQYYIRQQRQFLDQINQIELYVNANPIQNSNLPSLVHSLRSVIEDSAYGELQIRTAIWRPINYKWFNFWKSRRAWDVTQTLERLIRNGRLNTSASIGILGEPSPHIRKILILSYSIAGRKMPKREIEEGNQVILP